MQSIHLFLMLGMTISLSVLVPFLGPTSDIKGAAHPPNEVQIFSQPLPLPLLYTKALVHTITHNKFFDHHFKA